MSTPRSTDGRHPSVLLRPQPMRPPLPVARPALQPQPPLRREFVIPKREMFVNHGEPYYLEMERAGWRVLCLGNDYDIHVRHRCPCKNFEKYDLNRH